MRKTFEFRPESRRGRKPEGTSAAGRFIAYLSIAQSLYYAITSLWSLLSVGTFQRITGPKTDVWLVKTVGVLVGAIGLALGVAGLRREKTPEIGLLGAASAAGLAGIDAYYAGRRRISAVYLLDAVAEVVLLALWLYALVREMR